MAGSRHAELVAMLTRLAERAADQAGVELVELALKGSSKRRVLRVDIDRAGPRGVSLEDCGRVSGLLGEALEGEELISDSYLLEVSSPGLDRPIRTPDDIRRNTGRRVVVAAAQPVEGRRRFRGVLQAGIDGCLTVEDDELGRIVIPLDNVENARQEIEF